MRHGFQMLALLVLGLVAAPNVLAQGVKVRAMGSGRAGIIRITPRPVAHARSDASLSTFTTTTLGTTSNSNVFVVSPDTFLSPDILLGGIPVPGLGFDFPHLAAISAGAGVRALIDPVTQHELALARAIRRETPASFSTFPTFFPISQPIVVEPSVIVVPQAVAQPAEPRERVRAAEPELPTPPPAVEPAHEAGDFVLVKRDGGLLFAVAFTEDTAQLTYITKEGIRRRIPLGALDIDATVRMNEERGTPLQLPESLQRQ